MIASVRVLLLSFVVLGAIGCGKPHVHIPTPPPQLTPDQRVAAFKKYRQAGEGVEIISNCGIGGCKSSTTDLLLMGDGTEIRYAEDLLPLLPSDSPAASAARDVDTARRKSKRLARIGMLMFGGCFIGSMVAFSEENDPLMALGLAGALGGFGLWIASSFIYDGEINRKTKLVYEGYDQGLATKLDVCVNGLTVVPCEQSVPGELPPPTEPDPALRELRQK
jgi:hypothetical protein